MSTALKQGLKQSQQLILTPQLQQSIKILTLSKQELEDYLVHELKDNPCLEVSIPKSNEKEVLNELKKALSWRERDTVTYYSPEDHKDTTPFYENRSRDSDVFESLYEQLKDMRLTDYEFSCVEAIISEISDNGFLAKDLPDISSEKGIPMDDLRFALGIIQSCEPLGLGARNVKECLLIQARAQDEVPHLVETLISEHWDLFQKQDFKKIMKQVKVSDSALKHAVEFIKKHLDPRPIRSNSVLQTLPAQPDVFVFKRDGHWVVSLNEDGLPRIKLSKKYESMVENIKNEIQDSSAKKVDRNFVQDKIKDAEWVLRAISERNKTLLRVTEAIVEEQKEFFEQGAEGLKPMTLKRVAEQLDLHESTISRATNQKYMYTPRGLIELKYFFTAGMSSSQGESHSNEAFKKWIGDYIRTENPLKPFSDQDLAEILSRERGVAIARRTVAKYREALGILSSARRMKK